MVSNRTFLNLVVLNGNPLWLLPAVKQAGFAGVEIWQENVQAAEDGARRRHSAGSGVCGCAEAQRLSRPGWD